MPVTSPMLAKPYDFIQDPKGWMISEKLDGIRALWDGEKFISRNGIEIPAPEWFTADLPTASLDGELWIGRGCFQRTVSEVTSGRFDGVKFMVFDAPEISGGFRDRHAAVAGMINNDYARVAVHVDCKNRKHFRETFHAVTNSGGEGVVIRNPESRYTRGKSNGFLKLKKTADDEGIMKSHDGKALSLEWSGKKVKVKMPDKLRSHPPAVGSKITFQFNGLTDSGIPRHASFVSVRNYE